MTSDFRRRSRVTALKRTVGLLCLVAGIATFRCGTAQASDAELRTTARDLATQGTHAFNAGNFEDAAKLFERAYALVPAPSIALLRARSLAKLGRFLEATDVYEQTARLKLGSAAPEAYTRAVKTARDELEEVRAHLSHIKLVLSGVATGQQVEVTIDEAPMADALIGIDRPIDPGPHHIAAQSDGKVLASRDVSLTEGNRYEIELAVNPVTVPGATPASQEQPAVHGTVKPTVQSAPLSTPAPHATHTNWPAYASLSVGGLGLAIGSYAGLTALHHKSQLDVVCHPGCPQSSSDDLNAFRTERTVSGVSFGLGIAATVTGVLLLTVGKREAAHVSLRVLPNGMVLGGQL